MKLKASCPSISLPLVKENLRQCWPISALAFFVYFLSGVSPILSNYSELNEITYVLYEWFNNTSDIQILVNLLTPAAAAVLVYRYLHTQGAAAVTHSLPVNRRTLYGSGILSTLIISAIPVLLTGIILLFLSKPVYSYEGINVFSRVIILCWIGNTLVTILFVLALSILAGILTGNMIVHLLAAIGLNFFIPFIYWAFQNYCQNFLYGFENIGYWGYSSLGLSPLGYSAASVYVGSEYSEFILMPFSAIFIFLAVSLAILVLAGFLYEKRQLERAGTPVVFKILEPLVVLFCAFFSMTLIGEFIFQEGSGTPASLILGYAGGSLLGLAASQMIVKKTIWIFNLNTLKVAVTYTLAATLFLSVFVFDLSGFETRVPAAGSIKEVKLVDYSYYYSSSIHSAVFKDPENISAITAFHNRMFTERDDIAHAIGESYRGSTKVQITYDENGLSRLYDLSKDMFAESPELKQVFESDEFKNTKADEITELIEDVEFIRIENERNLTKGVVLLQDKFNIEEFLNLYMSDFKNSIYFEDLFTDRYHYASIVISAKTSQDEYHFSFPLTENCSETLSWLRNNSYDLILEPDSNDLKFAVAARCDILNEEDTERYNFWRYNYRDFVSENDDLPDGIVQIEDKQLLIELLSTGYHEQQKQDDFIFSFYFTNGRLDDMYYPKDEIPEALKAYFNE